MKKLLPSFLFLSVFLSFSQSTFHKSYDVGADDYGNKVIGTTQGIFVAGNTNNRAASGYDQYLMKLDSMGNVKWQTQFGGAQDDAGFSVTPFQGGAGYLVVGSTKSTSAAHTKTDALISLVDADGKYQGSAYFGFDSLSDAANDVISIGDTDFVIIGNTQANTDGSHTNMFVSRFDKEATPRWSRTYGTPGNNSTGVHIFSTPMGLFGVGRYEPGGFNIDGYLVNINDSTGAIEGQLTIGRPFFDDGSFVTFTNNAIVFGGTAGSIGGPNRSNIVLSAIQPDSAGLTQLWTKTYGGDTASNLAFLVTDTLDGNLIVAGNRFLTSPQFRDLGAIIFKVNAVDGSIMWSKTLGAAEDELNSGILLDDGSIVVSGSTTEGLAESNAMVARLTNAGEGCGLDISIDAIDITDSLTGPSIPTLRDSAVVFPMNMVNLDSLGHSVTELDRCLPTSIRTITSKGNTINIYPNPTSGRLVVESSTGWNTQVKMSVYDVMGAEVLTKTIQPKTKDFTIDLSGRAKGMYIISFNDGSTITTEKISIN
ncbi:MAG: hypothetical protein JWN78_2351 [Bacteroidota bacterium]|nr:hypothetical protein [Bacteroidota bacterium]